MHLSLLNCYFIFSILRFTHDLTGHVAAGERPVSKKRAAKDDRWGFGGRKRLGKQNDAASAADTEGYRPGRFDDGIGRRCGDCE